MEKTFDKKDVTDFLKKTEIILIQLVDSEFSVNLPAEYITSENTAISFEHNAGWSTDEKVDEKIKAVRQIFCFVGTNVTGKFKEDNPHTKILQDRIAFSGKFRFVVRYLYHSSDEIDLKMLELFSRDFSIPHVYAYIRNYVDMQFSLMGLPKIVMPLYKPKISQPPEPLE